MKKLAITTVIIIVMDHYTTLFKDAVCKNVMTHGNVMLREIQSYDGPTPKIEDDPKVKQCLNLNKLIPFFEQVFESNYGNRFFCYRGG